jgi:hypothetical protein
MNQQLNTQKNNKNKTIRKFSENMTLKYKKIEPNKTSNLAQRKKAKILIPTPITKERQKFNNILPFYSDISLITSRKNDSKNEINRTIGDIYKNILNNNNIKEKLLLKDVKIKIQKHSINQIDTPSGNRKKIKIKIYKGPKQIPKSNDGKILKIIDIKKFKDMKRKRKNIFNINADKINMTTINISNNDIKNKEKELSFINNYNIMQKENLKILSNHLDNLITNRIQSKSENHGINKSNENNCKIKSTFENASNEQDSNYKNRGCNTNVYRKKVERKTNNFIGSFLEQDYPNLKPKIKLTNLNKSQIINKKNCNNSHTINLLINRRKKFIFKRNYYQNENNLDFTPSNGTRSVKNNMHNIFGLINLKINRKSTNPIIKNNTININHNYLSVTRPSKQYINIENNNLISNNKANTFNFIDIVNPDSKRIETMISNNNNLDIRYKKKFNFNIQKDTKNNINFTQFEERSIIPDNEYSLNLNYFSNNNDNKKATLTNKWTTLYSNMSSQYNTINTLNNSENNIFNTNNNLNFKGKNNLNNVAPIKANKKIYYINNNNKNKNKLSIGNSYNSKTKLYIKNSLIKKKIKNITSQNSKEKKLKNVITSIEYCNNNNKSDNSTKKNVILSEVSSNGKINIRIREMENSIEKVIKENSINITNNMSNNNLDLPSPKKWDNDLTYIKKNQGTLFKKIKKHNTVNHLNRYYYPPPVPSK